MFSYHSFIPDFVGKVLNQHFWLCKEKRFLKIRTTLMFSITHKMRVKWVNVHLGHQLSFHLKVAVPFSLLDISGYKNAVN